MIDEKKSVVQFERRRPARNRTGKMRLAVGTAVEDTDCTADAEWQGGKIETTRIHMVESIDVLG